MQKTNTAFERRITHEDSKMANQIELCEFQADFYCPLCGSKIVDMSAPKIVPCDHLRYASTSEAPGWPEHIDPSLGDIKLSDCNELENIKSVKRAIKGSAMVFQLGGSNGYIDLYLIFEVIEEDQ